MNAQSRLTSSSSGHLAKIASFNGYKGGFFLIFTFLKLLNKLATLSMPTLLPWSNMQLLVGNFIFSSKEFSI